MMYKQTFFGKIPIHWEIMTLNEIGVIKGRIGWRGYTVEDLRETGPYVIGAGDITSKNTIDLSKAKHLSIEKYEESPEIILEKGDSIIVKVGSTIGKVGYFDFDNIKATINPNSVLFRTTNLDSSFVYYYLCTRFANNYLISNSPASAQPAINQSTIKKMPVIVPPLNEQIAIANILSSLDDKIEINNKINSNLEELAQTLYKRWFVDFEFPNEEGKPYKSSGGEMVESELGLIPKGWEVKTIHSIVKTSLGGTPSRNKPDYWDGEINWIKSGELNNLRITKPTQKISEIGLNSSAAKVMPIGTILIGITGYVGVVSMLEIDCAANQSVVGLIPNNEYPRSYLYSLVKTVSPEISLKQTGSAQQHINKNDIDTHKIVVPDNLAIIRFSNIAEPLHLSISNNLSQNDSLSITRDLLLPKLMSGKIEV